MMANCPNCGAPAIGGTCAYCGTPLEEPSFNIAVGKEVDASFEHEGVTYTFRFVIDGLVLEVDSDTSTFYVDGGVYRVVPSTPHYRISIDGGVVPREMHGRRVLLAWKEA